MTDDLPTADARFDQGALTRKSWLGLALTAVGAVMAMANTWPEPSWLNVGALTAAIAGLIVIGTVISQAPKNILVLAAGGGAAYLARLATHESWDSARLLFTIMACVAGCTIVVLMLPRTLQQVVVSALIVFHFCGIMSAITSPQPQTWLSNWAWVTLFRPHLVFCYTNNAYQFYSPDPGPASLLWYCVEFKDGSKVWFKSPRKPETHLDPLSVEYYRRLSMTEAVNQNMTLSIPLETRQVRQQMRNLYPLHPDFPDAAQYYVPQPHARRTLSSYIRHVAHIHQREDNPVRSIKAYRVLHRMLDARQLANGENPFGESTYLPFYLGEYDTDGALLNANSDPMLFWLIPILKKPTVVTPTSRPGVEAVDNFLTTHAGLDPFAERYGGAP